MRMLDWKRALPAAAIAAAFALSATAASAQQAPGAPGARATIDGRFLPPPPAPFAGEIDTNAAQSKPY